jgi:hypothetical protein
LIHFWEDKYLPNGVERPELVVDREALNLSQPRKDWYAEDTSGTKWPIF